MKTATQILPWMQESLDRFTAQLSLSKSAQTVQAYQYDVANFMQYLLDRKVKRMSSIKPHHIVDYLSSCKELGKSESSINRYYMSIRSFCRFLRRSKYIAADLTEDITPPRNNQKAPRIPSMQEIEAILDQPNTNTESGLRDRAILELLYSSGLRATELCSLQLNHISPNQVLISEGKRSKTRTVPITEEAFTWVELYIKTYRQEQKHGPLFVTKLGRPLRRQFLCKMVGMHAKNAGLEGITTHTLRHACATHLLDAGADLRLIQEILGHSSIASTQRYTHLSSSKMQQMFTQFHPRKKQHNEEPQDN